LWIGYFHVVTPAWPAQLSSNKIYQPLTRPKSFVFSKVQAQKYDGITIGAPHWSVAVAWAAVSGAAWIKDPRRYGLRTLLIGMALIALVFGGIAISE
jgi:hypothetical protein